MIANFFQNLEQLGVEYLLISGQATVLYGAATFSEDIDLWVNPTEENRGRFLSALCASRAGYYKLTPEFTVENLQRGHGFHFVLPDVCGEVFLDVMGNPPRAGAFADAAVTARWMDTEWGKVHTVGIQPLAELKKTQRLEDYPIIGKLALAWLEQPECPRTEDDFLWALHKSTCASLNPSSTRITARWPVTPAPDCLRRSLRTRRRFSPARFSLNADFYEHRRDHSGKSERAPARKAGGDFASRGNRRVWPGKSGAPCSSLRVAISLKLDGPRDWSSRFEKYLHESGANHGGA
jgi:hypothetical protein